MTDEETKKPPLYKLGIWIAEEAEEEIYSPGQIFIRAKEDELFRTPKFLGEGTIPEAENLLKLIDIVSQAMVNSLKLKKQDGRVYLVSLGEDDKKGIHFRLLPRNKKDKRFINKINSKTGFENDGLKLMADWRDQFLLKKKEDQKEEKKQEKSPFDKLKDEHQEAINKIKNELHNLAMDTLK